MDNNSRYNDVCPNEVYAWIGLKETTIQALIIVEN